MKWHKKSVQFLKEEVKKLDECNNSEQLYYQLSYIEGILESFKKRTSKRIVKYQWDN